MSNQSAIDLARRAFLRRSTLVGVAGAAAPWALNLSMIGDAAAASGPSDYKALVCVFLYGGNDYGNTLVPVDDAHYALYQFIRLGINTAQAELAATVLSPIITGVAPAPTITDTSRMAVSGARSSSVITPAAGHITSTASGRPGTRRLMASPTIVAAKSDGKIGPPR